MRPDWMAGAGLILAGSVWGQAQPAPDVADACWMMDGRQAVAAGGGKGELCPTQGLCDLPGVRDNFLVTPESATKVVRLRLVVFREDDGSNPAVTQEQLDFELARLREQYEPAKFSFLPTIEYVDDSHFLHAGDPDEMKLLYAEDPHLQCNVFIKLMNGGLGTFPWDPRANTPLGGILLGSPWVGGEISLLAHEMGHTLGLWHTHHGVSEVDPCGPCYEAVGGPEADLTGDFCADTVPTPTNFDCSDPAGADECSGMPWGDTAYRNYMGFGGVCWLFFTPQQVARMHCWSKSKRNTWLVCEGDGNGDSTIDSLDLLELLAAWGTDNPIYDVAPPGGDDIVDVQDLFVILTQWGGCG